MLRLNERWLYFFDILLKPYPDDAPYTRLKDLLSSLKLRIEKGESVKIM